MSGLKRYRTLLSDSALWTGFRFRGGDSYRSRIVDLALPDLVDWLHTGWLGSPEGSRRTGFHRGVRGE